MTPVENPNLHEVNLGDWDGGLYRIKAAEGDPIYQRVRDTQDWSPIPGAESRDVFFGRVRQGLTASPAALHTRAPGRKKRANGDGRAPDRV